jgi:hypothetical protein
MQLINNESMWVVLLGAVASCLYGLTLFTSWWQRLPDVAFVTLSAWLLVRFARLALPQHSRGPLLGVALILLTPRAALLPFTHSLAAAWFLASATALLSAKIYFRDGPKTSSIALLGMCMGIGLAGHLFFLAVLPWALIPAWAAARSRMAFARTQSLLLLVALGTWLIAWRYWRLPESILGSAPASLKEFLAGLGSASGFASWQADSLFAAALLIAAGGFLAGILRGGRQRDAGSGSGSPWPCWNSLWRLAPVFEVQLAIGLATVAVWISGCVLLNRRLPAIEELFLLAPLAVPAAAVGYANVTDSIRRQRRIPNWIAENLNALGLTLLVAANLLDLLKLAY